MNGGHVLPVAIVLGLSACTALPERPAPGPGLRLDSLPAYTSSPASGALLAVDGALLRQQYEGYLAEGGDPQYRLEVRRRIADLEAEGILPPLEQGDGYRSAIRQYEALLEENPAGPGREDILYGLARACAQQGEVERQQTVMAQLLREFPDSFYSVELGFRRAEHLFAHQRYAEAAAAYAAVLAQRDDSGSYREKAHYKRAWSLYRQHRYAEAVTHFLQLFHYRMSAQLVAGGGPIETLRLSEGDRALLQDVVRGVVLAASADDEVALRDRFATPLEEPYAYLVYGALVERYVEQARYHDAAETAREFVQRWPGHAVAVRLQLRLLEVIALGGFDARLEQERADLVNRYHPRGEHWRLLSPAMQAVLQEPLQSSLLGLAQRAHARAQRSRLADDYRQALHWYARFIDAFPGHPAAPQMSYLQGDAAYENRQYADAVSAYERSAYHYPPHAKSADAGYAALLAYRKHVETLAAGDLRDNWHWLGISSALSFVNRFPNDSRATALLASTVQELYAQHHYQRASDVARLLLARRPAPEAEVLRAAWTVLGYSEFELSHFAEAERAYREVLTMTGARDPLRPQRVEWLAAAIYKQAERARDNGQPAVAANHFMRVGELLPDTRIRITADYDAATSMIVAERWDEAIKLLLRFRSRYRDSPLQNSISEKLAVAYMRAGRQREAAREFEAIAAKRVEASDKREALRLAAGLYEKVADSESQVRLLKRYIKEFPSPLEPALEAWQTLARIAQSRGDVAGRDQWYRALIEAHDQQRNAQTVRTRFLASSAQLALARGQFEAFAQIRLTAPLQKNLQRKKGLMEKALAAYGKVIDYGSAETATEANWHIAELQRLLGRALLDSERPGRLSAEELEQYELMLEESAFPFEENAIKVHAANVARIPQGIYDEWVRRSMTALAQLMPARYGKEEQGEEIFHELH